MAFINQADPVKRQPVAGIQGGLSPMDPPDAYAPPGLDAVPLAELHPFLRALCEDHAALCLELKALEDLLTAVPSTGFTKETQKKILQFCEVLEADFIPHSRKEEASLFPLLKARLLEEGEHSKGKTPTTSVDLMLEDHLKVIQLVAVIANFLRLAPHLADAGSQLVVQDAALRQTKSLIALLRLHIFREDNIVFSSAHRLIARAGFDEMGCETGSVT